MREIADKRAKAKKATGEVKYSIGKDIHGTPFVEIETDILAGVPESEWGKTVRENLKKKYPNGIVIGRNLISIDRTSRREITGSEYTKKLRQYDPTMYADKMRSTDNADEILKASQNYKNEPLNHARKDDISQFARGTVLMRIGGNDYSAEVVVATKSNGRMLLYDIVKMQRTTIEKRYSLAEPSQRVADRNTVPFNNSLTDYVRAVKGSEQNKASISDRKYLDLARKYEAGDKSK